VVGNFEAIQYSGGYPLAIHGRNPVSLASLGVPESAWPRIRMIDSSVNQDGCKGATLAFAYSGTFSKGGGTA
jgi:hypothetical protein